MKRTAQSVLVLVVCCLAGAVGGQDYSWQKPHARVIETGDLEWAPEPFEFAPAGEVRYIDFKGGDDTTDGLTKETPWRHHPWDPMATGRSAAHKGHTTYVLKRGVAYRGALRAEDSGESGNPIRLTSDPEWGEGEALFYGSEAIAGGWRRGGHPDMPEPETVWHVDLDFAPRTLWLVENDLIERLALARDPNWTEPDPQDPMSEWYTWDNPEWWKGIHKTEIDGRPYHLGIDTDVLTGPAADYEGGTVWTEWGIVMGSPYPTRIHQYLPEKNAIAFGGPWVWWASEKIIANNRYYLEDKPAWLDSPGEFWFEKRGEGGRLYVRLPGDRDPSNAALEAGRHINLIDAGDLHYFEISGITFRFTNAHWEYDIPQWAHPDIRAGVFRMQGSGGDIVIRNNRFEHVNMPVRISVPQEGGRISGVTIADNSVRHTDQGAFHIVNREGKTLDAPRGFLDQVEILRNDLYHIGWRVPAGAHGHAISVQAVTGAHVAGNMLNRIAGWGISVSGGKRHPGADVPFVRDLVHHNRVEDCLLKSCDWGAFYITQGGPHYVYNNVAINPVGQMHWSGKRLGYAYYMDGGYKGYLFNNIALGYDVPKGHKRRTASAFQSMISFQNAYFNNTAHRFKQGSRRQAPQGGRERYMGNVFSDIGDWVFRHTKPADSPEAANAAHLPDDQAEFPYETNAWSHNILFDVTDKIGVFESHGMPYRGLQEFVEALQARGSFAQEAALIVERDPLRSPGEPDLRPAAGGAAVDYGHRVFVPWSLYAVVGEWHFTRDPLDAATVRDEHWYMTPYYVDRRMYRRTPRYHLAAVGVGADDYVSGPLEDWTSGALSLDGAAQYAVLPHKGIVEPFRYEFPFGAKEEGRMTVAGSQKRTVDIADGNFLIEAYFRTEADGDGGTLAGKLGAEAGYRLTLDAGGMPVLTLRSDGTERRMAGGRALNEGRWHHLIVECDRARDRVVFYVDGRPVAETSTGLPPGASLANEADFVVGRGLACTLEFLRVARGTLADAHTSIEELHEWQFNGPQLRDFCGREPVGRRDAGAIESR